LRERTKRGEELLVVSVYVLFRRISFRLLLYHHLSSLLSFLLLLHFGQINEGKKARFNVQQNLITLDLRRLVRHKATEILIQLPRVIVANEKVCTPRLGCQKLFDLGRTDLDALEESRLEWLQPQDFCCKLHKRGFVLS